MNNVLSTEIAGRELKVEFGKIGMLSNAATLTSYGDTVIMTNVSDITTYVNNMTKDDKVKKELSTAVTNINKAMSDISSALEVVNSLPADKKKEVSCILSDVAVSTANLRKFSEKLNKRFLLFRLMF